MKKFPLLKTSYLPSPFFGPCKHTDFLVKSASSYNAALVIKMWICSGMKRKGKVAHFVL